MRRTRQHMMRVALVLLGVGATACGESSDPVSPDVVEPSFSRVGSSHSSGAVYLMSNADGANEVLVYRRGADGSLTAEDPVPTGGLGTGAGLGNQGALAMTRDGGWLLVVNPGSDDVSLMRVTHQGVKFSDRISSGGSTPISVSVHGRLVYVLNAGMPNNVSGFRIDHRGKLHAIPGSTRSLSGDMVGPAQVGFSPTGHALVVTEKGTNQITSFRVGFRGRLSTARSTASAGETPFGFAFDNRGRLIVSEAFGGAADASTVSSYAVGRDGSVRLLDGPVATTETAACWIAIPRNGRFAYTTNAGSGSISGLSIGHRGQLALLDADGRTGDTGPGSVPLDAAFSGDGRYLYVLSSGAAEVSVFSTDHAGALTALTGISIPATANGMAAN